MAHVRDCGSAGLRDLNPARSRLTQIYLRDCDEVFVTCDIMRATNDRSILDVFELARQQAITKVGIICTKTDVCTFLTLTKVLPR